MAFFYEWMSILKNVGVCILDNSENIKNLTDIFISTVGGVCIITGINYLKNLKEKKYAATFGFWVQLNVKLKMLKKRLDEDQNLLNHMFSEESRKHWTNMAAPSYDSDIAELKDIARKTLDLIDTASDQMPAYPGWTEDYSDLIDFLDDVFRYDICNSKERFKYDGIHSIETRNEYVGKVSTTLKRLIEGIKKAQTSIEDDLF